MKPIKKRVMGAGKLSGQVNGDISRADPGRGHPPTRPVVPGGDAFGTHRVLEPAGPTARALPQSARRVDNDFSRLFEGEALLAVETLNIDAASFVQMEPSLCR